MTTRPRAARRPAALAAAALAVLLVAGCSGGSSSGDASSGDAAMSPAAGGSVADADGPERLDQGVGELADDGGFDRRVASYRAEAGPGAADQAVEAAVRERAVISTGTVDLASADVERVRFAVQRVVDQVGGEISEERTGTDPGGVVRRTRLVLRVPAASFDEAMTALADLGEVATLRSATRTSEDVTTQVIDVAARVRAQEKSLERVELLLTRADRLRDVIAIESQLTRRQAELDSLKQQQAYLADQTSLSTITVLVERPADLRERERDDAGFLTGLGAGWDALEESTVAVLTAVGAVLPFAVLLLLVGVPGWRLLRRLGESVRRRAGTAARTPSAAAAGPGPSTE